MSLLNSKYSPTQLMDAVKVDRMPYNGADHYVKEILGTIVLSKDTEELTKKLEEIVRNIANGTSVGMALRHLHQISTIGPEYDGDTDGIDALAHHLSGVCCTDGIAALQAVLKRFDELRQAKQNEVDRWHAERKQKAEQ